MDYGASLNHNMASSETNTCPHPPSMHEMSTGQSKGGRDAPGLATLPNELIRIILDSLLADDTKLQMFVIVPPIWIARPGVVDGSFLSIDQMDDLSADRAKARDYVRSIKTYYIKDSMEQVKKDMDRHKNNLEGIIKEMRQKCDPNCL